MSTTALVPFTDEAARVDLGAILRHWAADRPDAPFLTTAEDGATWTYAGFDAAVNRAAQGLRALGVERGDAVNLVLPNSVEYLALSYALKKLGAIEIAVNAEFRGAPLARSLDLAGARVTVTTPALLEIMDAASAERQGTRRVVVVGEGEVPERVAATPYATLDGEPADDPALELDDTAAATVIFTSGTTGLSKGCLLSHRALLRAAQGVAGPLELTQRDCVYTPYPLHHMRAAYLDVLPALLVGGRVVLGRRFSASSFWADMAEHGITVFSLIGTVMRVLHGRDPGPHDRAHRVRLTWGGPISVEPAAFQARFGVRVLPGDGVFGMSEIGMLCMTSDDRQTSGRVRPMYEVRIADEADDPLLPGETGEILVRPREPDVIFKEYLHQPEATLAAWRNLWFHTGDLGRLDVDGRLVFVGRRKDMIRRAGHNVAAAEVEEALASHPDVAACAAVGIPSTLGEEEVAAFVVPRGGATPSAADLAAHCRARLAGFAVPSRWELVDDLPLTATGKVARAELAARIAP